jgi:hypothetical protein
LINPEVNDLKPLKELVKRGLSSVEPTYSDLEAMERFYGLLGVSFVHEVSLSGNLFLVFLGL